MNETSVLQNLFETRDENTQNDVLAPDLPINDMSDLGDLALLKAALDEEEEMAVDEVEAGESPLNKSYESTPDIIARTGSDTYTPDSEILHVAPATQIEVALPEVSAERRAEYSAVYSRVVERIAAFRDLGDDVIEYDAEFTDGRIDSVRLFSRFVYSYVSSVALEFPKVTVPKIEMLPCSRPTLIMAATNNRYFLTYASLGRC